MYNKRIVVKHQNKSQHNQKFSKNKSQREVRNDDGYNRTVVFGDAEDDAPTFANRGAEDELGTWDVTDKRARPYKGTGREVDLEDRIKRETALTDAQKDKIRMRRNYQNMLLQRKKDIISRECVAIPANETPGKGQVSIREGRLLYNIDGVKRDLVIPVTVKDGKQYTIEKKEGLHPLGNRATRRKSKPPQSKTEKADLKSLKRPDHISIEPVKGPIKRFYLSAAWEPQNYPDGGFNCIPGGYEIVAAKGFPDPDLIVLRWKVEPKRLCRLEHALQVHKLGPCTNEAHQA
jgi:hypothetical protein